MSTPTPPVDRAVNSDAAASGAARKGPIPPLLAALGTVAIVGAILLFSGLGRLGLWDPYELTLADQGCRAAATSHAFDPKSCGVESAARPTDMRSFVMVQSVAWGFRTLGVTEAAGRIPLAIWALLGALAVTYALSKLIDVRAGLFAGIAFLTMPMVLVQGRLVLGDAATMGAFAVALSAFALAAFAHDERGRPAPLEARIVGLVIGGIATAAAIGARGLAVGATPAVAIGLAWLLRVANADERREAQPRLATMIGLLAVAVAVWVAFRIAPAEVGQPKLARPTLIALFAAPIVGGLVGFFAPAPADRKAERAVGIALLSLGALGIAEGLAVASMATDGPFTAAVAAAASSSRKFPTFDLLVRQVAHGAFPWSCLLPFAIGRALARPSGLEGAEAERAIDVRIAALLAAAIAYGVQTFLTPRFGLAPYAAPVALAIIVAIVLRDLERAPVASLAIAIGTAVFAGLVLNDFFFEDLAKTPAELATAPVLEPYAVYGVAAPEELRLKLRLALIAAAALFLLPVFFVWVDEDPHPSWTPSARLRKPFDIAVSLWKHPVWGLVLLLLASFEACLGLLGLVVFKKALRQRIPQLQALSVPQRDIVVNAWWYPLAAIAAAYAAYVLFLFGRDLFRNARQHRVTTIAIGGLTAAAIWSFSVMPAVANQFSPKGVFATYREKGGGAPIALLGVSVRTAAYELANATPRVFTDARTSYDWLNAADAPKKYLALKSEFLPELNRLSREKSHHNIPILDGRSAQILLAGNVLDGASQNPLDRFVLDGPPSIASGDARCSDPNGPICMPSNPTDCDIDGKLRCVGWELLDASGKPVSVVSSSQRVRLRQIWRVTGRLSGSWQVFIHVEQPGTATARKTSDHVPLAGKYGMENWMPGDVIVDDNEFNLEPNMKSGFPITILTGFFSGNTRMQLVSGRDAGAETEGARLVLGSVRVQ